MDEKEQKTAAAPTPDNPKPGEAPKSKTKRRMNSASLANLKKGPPAGKGEKRAPAAASAAAPAEPPKPKAGWSFFEGW